MNERTALNRSAKGYNHEQERLVPKNRRPMSSALRWPLMVRSSGRGSEEASQEANRGCRAAQKLGIVT